MKYELVLLTSFYEPAKVGTRFQSWMWIRMENFRFLPCPINAALVMSRLSDVIKPCARFSPSCNVQGQPTFDIQVANSSETSSGSSEQVWFSDRYFINPGEDSTASFF